MKLYATFFFLWLALISALTAYVGLYRAVAHASAVAFEESLPPASPPVVASDDARLKKYIVSPDALPSFTKDIVARAEAAGVSASVVPAPASDTRFFRFVLFVDGDFAAVMRSIGVIEYAPYVLSVEALTAGVGVEGLWHAEMTFSVGSQADV